MTRCLIGLGANLGNREETLAAAARRLVDLPATRGHVFSRWRETAPVGGPPGQPSYLNGAASFETDLPPEALFARLRAIESEFGRTRDEWWGSRTLDLDLLLYGDLRLETPALTIPHPHLALRRFVLEPAQEIAADMVHPVSGWTIGRLWENLRSGIGYVAITGAIGAGKSSLARAIVQKTACALIEESLDDESLTRFYASPKERARETESRFLTQRADALKDVARIAPTAEQLVVSDFWFDQSLAFASVWLDSADLAAYRDVWERTRRLVPRPRLLIVVDAETEELKRRVAQRGRRYEAGLDFERLDRIRRAILERVERSDLGAVLRTPPGCSLERAVAESLAAIESIRPVHQATTERGGI